MEPEELDQILARSQAEHEVSPEVLERISGAIVPGLRPVRPMASPSLLVAGLLALGLGVGIAGAAVLGMHGLAKLSGAQAVAIFAMVGLVTGLAASQSAAEMVPGSKRTVNPYVLVLGGSLALLSVFAVLFRGYSTDGLVEQGFRCLRAGLLHALPTGAAAWLILRRGFAVDPTAAGMVAGTLAGMAGLTMLELHCANLQAIHVMIWHVGVVAVSAAAGAALTRGLTFRARSAAQPS